MRRKTAKSEQSVLRAIGTDLLFPVGQPPKVFGSRKQAMRARRYEFAESVRHKWEVVQYDKTNTKPILRTRTQLYTSISKAKSLKMQSTIIEHYTTPNTRARATATIKAAGENSWTLCLTMFGGCDPGDYIEIFIEEYETTIVMDGLSISKKFVFDWLDRLIEIKRDEASETSEE